MITSRMESLNLRTRIIQRVQAGDRCSAIARAEGVSHNYVNRIARQCGIVRTESQASKPINPWDEIHANLKRWNKKHGRLPKTDTADPANAFASRARDGRDSASEGSTLERLDSK